MSNDIFLARQPILDADRRTFGYELLYRDGPGESTFFEDPDDATQCVIERTLLHWGIDRIVGDRFGLINASANLFRTGLHRALPPEGIIIEVRDGDYGADTVEALRSARREGYHIALDNVTRLDQIQRSQVLQHASMLKIELSQSNEAEVVAMVQLVRETAPGLLLVAEKVETRAQFDAASALGFDLFQGYFFAKPELMQRAARPANVASALALLAEVHRPDIDIDRVERLVGSDPTLAYRLLAVVNSSAFGLDRRVSSLRHAIVLLGVNQVRHLAMLLTLSASANASEEVITIGATRARLASRLVDTAEEAAGAFTVGLLSVTDVLYGAAMSDLLHDLPVSDEIRTALTDGSGALGRALEVAIACERGDATRLIELVPDRIEQTLEDYGEAVQWADALRAQLNAKRSRIELKPLPRTEPGTPVPA